MGNEHSKSKEQLNRNGGLPEKQIHGSANILSANISSNGTKVAVNVDTTVQQNNKQNLTTESNDFVIVESDCKPDASVISEIVENIIQKEEVKASHEDQTDVSLPATEPQTETADLKQESESLTAPESVTLDSGQEGEKADKSDNGNSQPVENQEEKNPEKNTVMNFFKTIASSKIAKKETATADATKDQVAQVSEPPAAPKGMSIPPPPPPEPPKMEIKAEPAAKPVKPTPKEEPKAAAKEPKSSKGKSTKDTLSKFFRSKKVDSSKAGTLEAAAKPEPPPPVQEAKKTASKSSLFSFFKPKADDPKKATPAPVAAVDTGKAKEEPKAAAKSSEAVVDNKPASVASQTGGDAANAPKKLEKRNSIQLFFKILGQKRNSTDAGIQTEPVTVAPAAEKAK